MGPSNKLAYAAAHAVSDRPGVNYNPLFIYGDSGLGKTHLLYAIAHGLKQNYPDAKVVYIKGDDFTNELVASIREGKNAGVPGEIPPGDTAAGGRRAVHRR